MPLHSLYYRSQIPGTKRHGWNSPLILKHERERERDNTADITMVASKNSVFFPESQKLLSFPVSRNKVGGEEIVFFDLNSLDTVHQMFPLVNHQVLPPLQSIEQEVPSPGGKFV